MGRIYLYSERLLNSKLTCLTCLEKLNFLFLHLKTTVYRLQSCDQMRGAARFLVQSATKTKQIKPVNGLASMATPSSKFWFKFELYSPFPECLTFSSHVCSLKNHTGMMTITTPQRHGNENTCILIRFHISGKEFSGIFFSRSIRAKLVLKHYVMGHNNLASLMSISC